MRQMKKPDLWFPDSNPVGFSLLLALDRHNYRMIHEATILELQEENLVHSKGSGSGSCP